MENYEEFKDNDLISMLRNGNSGIMDFLLEKYKPIVKKQAKAMFLIGGENDDLIQEGMIGLFKAVRDYNENLNVPFESFARICVQRQMMTAIKISNRKKNVPLNDYVSYNSEKIESDEKIHLNEELNPEYLMITKENLEGMDDFVKEKLSNLEYQVLKYYMDGMNYSDIAKKLEKPPKSIDNAISRIKNKLRKEFSKKGNIF
ncbi:RNA polymerase, sigma 30 subunit, SigH [Acetitomaculum ruminis DSM 5522]|uniref:RNA polymerase sigma factor SigS n=1 Tax=Acetitomaculum ruminis DSM 5522 TaxID=1120918 RepID=A0A1I0WJR0_9FIRM|nr:sigma-70 family RNA polymerase sigma factor [Acetitomaculum ruminis]SFA88176.1 RNA polymerase, sigma 30 subunit, SigH [Acetitomaculum ruminis DSM 5522]